MHNISELMQKLDMLSPLLDAADNPQLKVLAKFLAERISSPESFVTFLGETSSGKSTLINGLLGKTLLPVKACPTTGTISEIMLSSEQKPDKFYAVNKDATMEALDRYTCLSLIEQPDEELSRVRIVTHFPDNKLQNMRIFDTPGYDSIVSEHEEILKDFLPNSDVVIYTISYKIGIQENDYAFLGFLKELLREDADILFVINRCPAGVSENNPRIREIKRYAKDILLETPQCFLIPAIQTEDDSYPLPPAKELWNYVGSLVNSEKRINALYEAFDSYIAELYEECREAIQNQYTAMKLNAEELQEVINEQKQTADRIREAVRLFVDPGFKKAADQIPRKMEQASEWAEKNIIREIKDSPTGKMDEMIAYTNAHLLPYYIRQESKEVQNFIQVYLDDINQQVDDYLNKEINEFNTKISIVISTHKEIAAKNIAKNVAGKAGYQGLLVYFTSFGGAGGANAGIANAASHILKKIGDTFGKTFSRETHNALKHTLSKIGATSMKAVGAALTVIIELAAISLDYATWKNKLIPKVSDAVDKWKDDTIPTILSDLENLKNQNIQAIYQIADEVEHTFESDISQQKHTEEELVHYLDMCDDIGRKIGVI